MFQKFFPRLFLCLLVLAVNLSPAIAEPSRERPSYLIFESNTGRILFAGNAEAVRPISCLSQVATAIVAIDWINRRRVSLEQMITVPTAVQAIGMTNNPFNLRPGDRLTLRDAIFSTVFRADSASAYSMAWHVGMDLQRRGGGGDPIALFVQQMNALAKNIGMTKTTFVSPHGLENKGRISRSCAVDLALLGMYAMQNNAFAFVASQATRTCAIQRVGGAQPVSISNFNRLLSQSGVDGIKSASSKAAGGCLMFSVTRNSVSRVNPKSGQEEKYPQRLIGVILGMDDRFGFARDLIHAAWPVWDRWQKTSDYSDARDFLFFRKRQNILP
ncbi:MAG: hypothetical protein LUG84_05740 [Akkermansiaceae bacterium]|nr:hypothetical protein [Akkermansia sp.]MCD7798893.1 hypothetical protein [Akkermansiaceae bacterium]